MSLLDHLSGGVILHQTFEERAQLIDVHLFCVPDHLGRLFVHKPAPSHRLEELIASFAYV